jgi:hypothetical protein
MKVNEQLNDEGERKRVEQLRAAALILRKLRIYSMMDYIRPYNKESILGELKIETSIGELAIEHLINQGLLLSVEANIELSKDRGAEVDLLLPEELLFKSQFCKISTTAVNAIDPSKGGAYFHKNVFVIMAYDPKTDELRESIKEVCDSHGLNARFADKQHFAEEVWENVAAYAITSRYALALFHQTLKDNKKVDHNPNVAFEVGLMIAWGRPCCLIKDKGLKSLHSDLVGWTYRECDFGDPHAVKAEIDQFFKDLKNKQGWL